MIKSLTLPKGAREELGIGEDMVMHVDDDEGEDNKNQDEDEDLDPAKVAE
jgi:bifunctional DNA-binding transcriptional regulator/antitoxin component of YhaV-PrlF toxin-antitoxin module